MLRVTARDASLWRWFGGNEAVVEKSLAIDITPPTLELIADDRYINFGGVGAIVYKASADTARSGVRLGERVFPASRGRSKTSGPSPRLLRASLHAPPNARPCWSRPTRRQHARDAARLRAEKRPVQEEHPRAVRQLPQGKVAPLLTDVAARQGAPKDIFVASTRLRKENDDRIAAVTASDAVDLWKGAFSQLSNRRSRPTSPTIEPTPTTRSRSTPLITSATTWRHEAQPGRSGNSGTVAFVGDLASTATR